MHSQIFGLLVGLGCSLAMTTAAADAPIDFNRDIRPILSEYCYACHGPDAGERQGGGPDGLRLDTRDGAFADLGGYHAIVPGDPEQSELVDRVLADDPYEAMPPADYRKSLSETQKQRLARWVREGAQWSQHWAYIPPQVESQPPNWIDRLVQKQVAEVGLEPSPPADRRTLVRRAFFDVIGLPPNPQQVDEFLNDSSPDAWEHLVDRLLASPHYGERMAIYWLDLVRYADTVGYHGDQDVSVSPYRDYVIDAFNRNKPFDQFTREQLAGDLVENPTDEQLIASGYNKLGMMSAEGGAQPKEYLTKYASDRVRTASSVWMGSTLGCAECHDHKFDPFTQKDFYQFAAFFADIKERGLYAGANRDGKWGPSIVVPDEQYEEKIKPAQAKLDELKEQYETTDISAGLEEWLAQQSSDDEKLAEPIRKLLDVEADKRTAAQKSEIEKHFRSIAPSLADLRQEIEQARQHVDSIQKQHTRTTLITASVEPREIRVLPRGNWMDDSGEVVQPDVPHFLPPLQIDSERRATRLDLANWLTSSRNPLTARVTVNRFWKLFFGTGLSKQLDDLGSQGEFPSHPDLLDRLAVEFIQSGWNVKHIIKLILMSDTYRQSSLVRNELAERDPYNRLLARQSRFRLDAEMIRDNHLAVSGLLIRKVGGRSVKPYQPAGLLRHLNFPKRTYQADEGSEQYRRGVYTHWQRQFLHPAMKSFDAPSREECTAQRPRSNTPLAALVLLNDPSYVEAARVFAERALTEGGSDDATRVDFVFREALGRPANQRESDVILQLLASQRNYYASQPAEAAHLIAVGQRPVMAQVDSVELAAMTAATRAVFNMHEFITRN